LKAFPNNPTSNKMSSAQSETQQQEIDWHDTDKMPTIADIDKIYRLKDVCESPMAMLTLDRVSNLLARLAEDDISFPEPETDDDDDVMCVDCDYGMSRQAFERGKGRIMFGLNVKYLKRKEYRCGCCDDRVSDPQGEFPDTDSEEEDEREYTIEKQVVGMGYMSFYDEEDMLSQIVYCKNGCWKLKGDDTAKDLDGELCITDDDEPQHDICCGCGKYDDTRPVCDCGGSHRSNCAECELVNRLTIP